MLPYSIPFCLSFFQSSALHPALHSFPTRRSSDLPSEGKTTTVVNIATMLAQTGADVLVLDCDLRRPRVLAHFGLPNARGVTNYLSGDASVSDLVQTYGPLPNLKVITSGPIPPNAAELLGSDEMRKLLY